MASKSKLFQRLLMISNGLFFQMFSAFSTAIIAYYVISNHNTIIWGQFASIWILITVFTIIFNFGSKEYLIKEFSKPQINIMALSSTNMAVRLPWFLICLVLSFFVFPINQVILVAPLLLISFVFNSFYPMLVYEKRFSFLLFVEVLSIISQLLFLFAVHDILELKHLLISFIIYNTLKLISLFFLYGTRIIPSSIEFNIKILKSLMPYFLLALGGMLVNKADFIVVTAQLDDITKAHYHIISTFSTIGIIAAHALLQPFLKEIYRVNWESFKSIAQKYFGFGVVLSLLYVFVVKIIIGLFFKLQLSNNALILLYAIELVFFATNPLIFFLFRNDKQHHLVFIVLGAGLFTLMFAWLFVKPYGIDGALMANLLGNCIILLLLWMVKMRINSSVSASTANIAAK